MPGIDCLALRSPASRGLACAQGVRPNADVLSGAAFRLRHDRAGVVSLALGANDDDAFLRERRGYTPLQFMVTTGEALD